jgi:hypothetical protein
MKKFGKLTNERNATRSSQGIEHFSMCEVFSFWIDFPYILVSNLLDRNIMSIHMKTLTRRYIYTVSSKDH